MRSGYRTAALLQCYVLDRHVVEQACDLLDLHFGGVSGLKVLDSILLLSFLCHRDSSLSPKASDQEPDQVTDDQSDDQANHSVRGKEPIGNVHGETRQD
jgi:hypothetical protein